MVFFGFGKKDYKINNIEVDVFTSVSPKRSRRVPIHPVDKGYSFSDNIVKDPLVLEVSGIVSLTPVDYSLFFNFDLKDRVRVLVDNLIALWESTDKENTVITIVDGDTEYKNMALTNLQQPRTATTNNGDGEFTATFQQIQFIEREFVDAEYLAPKAKETQAETKDLGKQTKKEVPNETILYKSARKLKEAGQKTTAVLQKAGK